MECKAYLKGRLQITAGILLAGLFAVVLAYQPAWAADGLDSYHNKNRVLLLFAPSKADARYRRQSALLRDQLSGLRERDLIVLDQVGASDVGGLHRRFHIERTQFHVMLIGKDGHTALRADHPLSASQIFAVIDAMPMRRDEMRRQRKQATDRNPVEHAPKRAHGGHAR